MVWTCKGEVEGGVLNMVEDMEADSMQRWKRYFSELLNEENQYELEDHLKVEGPILSVTVEEALQKMTRGKAPGPSGVTTYLLRCARETGVQELKKVDRGSGGVATLSLFIKERKMRCCVESTEE